MFQTEKPHSRCLLCYEFCQDKNATEIARHISRVYGDEAIAKRTAQ